MDSIKLTIIGTGPAATIIGPALPWTETQGDDSGIYFAGYDEGRPSVLDVHGMRFENVAFGIVAATSADTLRIFNCEFVASGSSIMSFSDVTEISACRFLSLSDKGGRHVNSIGQESLRVANSEFAIEQQPHQIKAHLNLQSARYAIVESCEFIGGRGGASVSSGTDAELRGCTFDSQSFYAITLGDFSSARVEDCSIVNQDWAFYQYGHGSAWAVERVHFENVSGGTLEYAHLGGGYIRNCTLARGARYVVADINIYPIEGSPLSTLDMTNNWWGTSDPDSIQAWIYDSNDQPTRPYYYIQWDPYRAEPMAAEKKSLGDVKALFR